MDVKWKSLLQKEAQERRKTNERPGSRKCGGGTVERSQFRETLLMNLVRILYQPNIGRSRTVDLHVSLLAANNALICHSFDGHILCSLQIVNVFLLVHLIISHIKISSLNYALIIENSKEHDVHMLIISCKRVSAVACYSKMI